MLIDYLTNLYLRYFGNEHTTGCEAWLRIISKDKPPIIQYLDDYPISATVYARGAKWRIDCYVTYRLTWIDSNFDNRTLTEPEFLCTWLPKKEMQKIIEHIINTHPNLNPKMDYKVGYKFNIC